MAKAANANAVAGLLDQLNDLVPAKAPPKAGAKQKWEVELTGRDAENFIRWLEAKSVGDLVDARLETSKDELTGFGLNLWANTLWKTKNKPGNPVFIVKRAGSTDCLATFIVQDKFKTRFPEIPEGANPRDFLVGVFVDLGLEQADAEGLVDNELDLSPVVGITSLTELTQGKYGEKRAWIDATPEQQEAGRKLLAFLTARPGDDGNVTVEGLTPAERVLLIQRGTGVKVKAGFYSRVCTYVHSAEQLRAVFKVIVPIAYPSHQKFGVNDTPNQRATRLIESAAGIVGVGVKEQAG